MTIDQIRSKKATCLGIISGNLRSIKAMWNMPKPFLEPMLNQAIAANAEYDRLQTVLVEGKEDQEKEVTFDELLESLR